MSVSKSTAAGSIENGGTTYYFKARYRCCKSQICAIILIRVFYAEYQKKFGGFQQLVCAKMKRVSTSVGYQIVNRFFPQAVNIYGRGM